MKTYEVELPIVGTACKVVEAKNEDEAIEKALSSTTLQDIESFEPVRHVMQGNVCHAPLWDASAEEQ